MSKKNLKKKKVELTDELLDEIFQGRTAEEIRKELKKRGLEDEITVIGKYDYCDACGGCNDRKDCFL
ncbi:MAG TPA: hypothetical protein P5548_00970 [Candidatus Moranbacteria bacterium]|nr:hypothetical protein [Candidatus Moranbacteria bacterium]HRZ33464.1 hypothetical protein [Candidatus Moranbacteria bacterium]